MKLIIGLIGKPGAGKGTFKRLLRNVLAQENRFPSIGGPRFSDALRETLEYFEVLPSRDNLQELARWLEARKPGAVTSGMRRKLEEDAHEIKIADGVRWPHDEKMIRGFLDSSLIYIVADPKTRWERIRQRKEKQGDAAKIWEEFLKEDQASTEVFVDDIGSRADFTIDNNGVMEEYQKQVREFYVRFLKSAP